MINQKSAIKNKSKMILVFGGTTEGKQTIEMLRILQIPFIYSTKTQK